MGVRLRGVAPHEAAVGETVLRAPAVMVEPVRGKAEAEVLRAPGPLGPSEVMLFRMQQAAEEEAGVVRRGLRSTALQADKRA